MPPGMAPWLELPLSRTNFHGPKGVRAIEVRLYLSSNVRTHNFLHMRPVKIQVSLHIRVVWSESSLRAFWMVNDAKFLHTKWNTRWLSHVVFRKGAHFFNVKIARFKARKLYLFQVIAKQITSHIRIWALFIKHTALFINIQRIHIHHAVVANSRSKCIFRDGNVGSVHTFVSNVCKYCTQELNKLYVYEKCSYSYMRCTLFYENWLDITCEKSMPLPWIERSKSVHPSKKPRDTLKSMINTVYVYFSETGTNLAFLSMQTGLRLCCSHIE